MAETNTGRGVTGLIRRSAATFAVLGALAGGGVLSATIARGAEPATVVDARKLIATKPEAAVKSLKTALLKTNDPAEQSAIRLALVDAYLAHGRPIDAVPEAQAWLKANATSAQREQVIVTLIAAQRQANEWDGAAATSRSFIRDFPKSASREQVLTGLVEIARYGQNNLASEASALGEYIDLLPNAKDLDARMLRLARVQEQTGDLAGAVQTIRRFVDKHPGHEQASDVGWRAVWLLHDRLRKTADAVAFAESHLRKHPKRPSISRDWQYVGDLCRSIEKSADAQTAYKQAIAADPENADAAAALLDTVYRQGTLADAKAALQIIEKNFAKHRLALDAKITVLRRQFDEKDSSGKAMFDDAIQLVAEGHRVAELCALSEQAASKWSAQSGQSQTPAVIDAYRKLIVRFKTGPARTDVAIRLATVLRSTNKIDDSTAVLAMELKENPANRRELTRDYLVGVIDARAADIANKKHSAVAIEQVFKELAELVRPHAHMPELRAGMDEAAGPLNRLKLKDATNALRQEIEKLSGAPLAMAVDACLREGRRDATKVAEALSLLARDGKDKPYIFEIVGESVMWAFDRVREDYKPRLLPWLGLWADARPENLSLNREVGEAFRRFGKNAEAAKYLARVVNAPATRENAWQIGVAMGSLLDLQAFAIKEAGAVEKLAARLEAVGALMPAALRQERYRQFADIHGRQKDGKEKQLDYYRKAVALGLTDQSIEAARGLLAVLSADQAVSLGKQWLSDPANDRFSAEVMILVAQRMATGQKDLAGAAAMMEKARQRRETALRSELEDSQALRDLIRLAQDAASPQRIADPARKTLLAGMKPLTDEQSDGLMQTALRWLGGEQLHEVAAEVIRQAGAAKNLGRQLDVYSQIMARTRPNHGWHWERNMATIKEEIARPNLGVASTMLRLLLKQSSQYQEEARQAARNLLVQAYARFGEDLLAVPDDKSPIAALVKGANYLKLGEEKQAWEIYTANSKLFADKIDEVPAEYVLFVGDTLARGTDAERDVAEQLLRVWLARIEKVAAADPQVKAAISLKLADVFFWGRRYDVARAEYQSVIDKFPDTKEAIDARFRIGESLMYQKNYAEAGKVFETLRKSRDAEVSIRGTFMTGVLQYTQGLRDEARETFKSLLDLSPTEEVASKTLFQLALIYGDDKRFKEMLDMLQAIGSFGGGKRWHTPAQTLTVMIHDPDLAIVQEASTVPVVIRTTTGDRETVNMVAGSAGRGIFMAMLPTALGSPRIGDGTLQLLGNDTITYDYPDEFKKKFKYIPPPQGNIRIAADGQFWASATKIEDEKQTSVVEKAADTQKIKRPSVEMVAARGGGSFRPGNPIYLRVTDPDRSLTTGIDRVEVILTAQSGDSVRVLIPETGPDTGVFEGQVPTAERPPETIASDSALSRPAAFAGDKDPKTAWESQHDGQPGKWITADLKDVYPVKQFKYTVPNPASNAPTKWMLWSSMNGQMWEAAYSTEKGKIAHGLSLNFGPLRHTRWAWSKAKAAVGVAAAPQKLSDYMALLSGGKLPEGEWTPMNTLAIPAYQADAEADVHLVNGYFPSTAGKYTFFARLPKNSSAVLIINNVIVSESLKDLDRGVAVDLTAGWNRLVMLATTKGELAPAKAPGAAPAAAPKPAPGRRGPAEPVEELPGLAYLSGQASKLAVPLQSLPTSGGRDASMPAPAAYAVPAEPKVATQGDATTIELAGLPARMVKLDVIEYQGDYVSISGITVLGEDPAKPLLPTDVDIVGLGDDDILQVTPGDNVTAAYSDQVNIRTPGTSRLLSSKLQATYFNATVKAITYEVQTGGSGQVSRTAKELYRIDPGERIVALISDPDEDVSDKPDKIKFRVRTETGAELADLEAQETGETTGTFTREIETTDKPAPGKLLIKPGERIYVIYSDKLNTTPGSRTDRTAELQCVKPTDSTMAILPTRVEMPEQPKPDVPGAAIKAGKGGSVTVAAKDIKPTIIYLEPVKGEPARVVLAAPLTIEVFDPDAAKDSHSTVQVEITTSAGAKLTLPLEISDAARPSSLRGGKGGGAGATAVEEGRFVGQALLLLGRPNAQGKYDQPISVDTARGLLGAWKYKADEAGNIAAPIVPISGADLITATYVDKRTPSGKEATHNSAAKMVTDASLANLDRGFENAISVLHVGERMYIRVEDGDRDATPQLDTITIDAVMKSGQKLQIKLVETLGHSGVFTGEVMLQHIKQATTLPATAPTTRAATVPADETADATTRPATAPALVSYQIAKTEFGDTITLSYTDEHNTSGSKPIVLEKVVNVAVGSDATMLAFTKQFGSETVAVETQFKLAECYFELFKSHMTLNQTVEMRQALEMGRGILSDLRDNYRGSAYEARVLYLLGSFHQELKEWDEALESFRTIVRVYPNSPLAPDAQYKLGQCYEDRRDMDLACEEYVRLAYTYPDNPLIAKCMVRLSDYFYKTGKYAVAANVCGQFLEQYPEHEWASKIAFRQGQCYFKDAEALKAEAEAGDDKGKAAKGGKAGGEVASVYIKAAKAFDFLVDRYTDADVELRSSAMFWSGQSYHKAGDFAAAYRKYRRCTWDYPDTDAARYARGQLTLPEIAAAEMADQKAGGGRK